MKKTSGFQPKPYTDEDDTNETSFFVKMTRIGLLTAIAFAVLTAGVMYFFTNISANVQNAPQTCTVTAKEASGNQFLVYTDCGFFYAGGLSPIKLYSEMQVGEAYVFNTMGLDWDGFLNVAPYIISVDATQ